MDIKCGIYQIKNKINGKLYVGQSVNIIRRWQEHKSRPFENGINCTNIPLYQSIRKYGLENFEFSILEECSPQQLNEREAFYIQEKDCIVPKGYNVSLAAYEFRKDIKKCKECGKIITKTSKLSLCRECYNKSIRKCEWPSAETLSQLLQTNSFESVGRMYGVDGNSIKKWCNYYNIPAHASDYRNIREFINKPVYQYTLTGEYVAEYINAAEAIKAINGKDTTKIYECLRKQKQSYYGYQWSLQKCDNITTLYGQIGTIYSKRKIRCIETNEIFESIQEAMNWCGLKSNSGIYTSCSGKGNSAGKHPITGEKLHWEYVT